MALHRRDFMKLAGATSAVVTVGATAPGLWGNVRFDADSTDDRILVVVQLTGGNDGLNTIVPYGDDIYYQKRPKLSIAKGSVQKIDEHSGWNPELAGLAELYQGGNVAVIQNVGYPKPNRSHFESMDIWHSCTDDTKKRNQGWLGKYLDQSGIAEDAAGFHIGREKQPLALSGTKAYVPSIQTLEDFKLRGKEIVAVERNKKEDGNENPLLDFVTNNAAVAIASSAEMEKLSKGYESKVAYPDTPLADKLRIVAQLIEGGWKARVYYVELDGFDTHANQIAAHTALLRQFNDAVTSFWKDMVDKKHSDRVMMMSFSEFGRRVAENASEGTDHGAAAPMFLIGNQLKSGLHGSKPNLTDLDDGDIKFKTDFRSVYADVLEGWFKLERSDDCLGGKFDRTEICS